MAQSSILCHGSSGAGNAQSERPFQQWDESSQLLTHVALAQFPSFPQEFLFKQASRLCWPRGVGAGRPCGCHQGLSLSMGTRPWKQLSLGCCAIIPVRFGCSLESELVLGIWCLVFS